MTQAVVGTVLLDAPSPDPLTGTLLDSVEVITGRVEPLGMYTSLNCMTMPESADICAAVNTLAWNSPITVNGVRFVADIGVFCQGLVGWDALQPEFARAVELRESAAVEQNLMALRFTGTAGGAAAHDITPTGGAVDPRVGIAMLEGDAAKNYVGIPTIHSPRTIASLINSFGGTLHQEGVRWYSSLGSKFVAGAGYDANVGPGGAAPAAGEMWVYATGEVRVTRLGRVDLDPILDRGSNISYLRSQRPYIVDVDCYVAAVRVKLA